MSGESTASLYSALLGHLADPALRSILFAGLAALALKLGRIHAAAARLTIWRGVLFTALAMPVLVALLPGLFLPVLPWPSPRRAESAPPVGRVAPPARAEITETAEVLMVPAAPAAQPRRTWFSWPMISAATYFLVAGFLLARLGLGILLSRRLRRRSRRIVDAPAQILLKRLSATASLSAAPELAESSAVAVPVTLGIRRSIILLPVTWRDWEEAKLRAVLAHEISHVALKDARTQALAALHRCLFWFSPLSWWLERHLAELAEQASDDAALASVSDRTYYAEILIGFLAAVEGARGRINLQGVSMAKSSKVEQRVDRILSAPAGLLRGFKRPMGVGLMLAALPLVCVFAAVRPETRAPSGGVEVRAADAAQAIGLKGISGGGPQAPSLGQAPAAPAIPPGPAAPKAAPPATPAVAAVPQPPQAAGAPQAPQKPFRGNRYDHEDEDGEAFVIVSGDSVTMSGGPGDMRHAKSLQQKISGDYIWFRRDGKGYVIHDAATVRQAKEFFAPQEALGRQQEELGKKQEELGRQQEALGKKMQEVRVKVPDLTAELKQLETQLAKLREGGTREEIGRAQEAIGRMQERLGNLQGQAGAEQGKLGEQMGALGHQQGELGAQQGKLGEEQGRLAREANRKVRALFNDAVKKGLAQPE